LWSAAWTQDPSRKYPGLWGEPKYFNTSDFESEQNPRKWAHSALKVRKLVEKYEMRVLPGHDNKIIAPDKTAEQGFKFEEVKDLYD